MIIGVLTLLKFMQYMKNDNWVVDITQLPLGEISLPSYLKKNHSICFHGRPLNYVYLAHPITKFCLQLVWIIVSRLYTDVCSSKEYKLVFSNHILF